MEVVIKRNRIFLICFALILIPIPANPLTESGKEAQVIELPKEAVSKKVLENGLTVLAKHSSPPGLVSIDIKIMAGPSLEGEYVGSGISHLVEHMVFKGTPARPVGVIEKEIKSYGGFINGSVSQDLTAFHATVQSKYFNQALSLFKDMLSSASFDSAEFDKEKEVILKEMNLNKDEPQTQLIRLLNETAYMRHLYKYPVIGYDEGFKRLKREDALRYYNRMYVPNRIVIAVVGDVDEAEAGSSAEREFKNFRRPNYSSAGLSPAEPDQISERRLEKEIETTLSYLAIGFHSTGILDEDLFAMDVLAMILGRGDNSRLNTALFKDKRMVYSISCWNYTPRDPGLLAITAILDKDRLDDALGAVNAEIDKMRESLVNDKELEIAKRMVLGDFIFSLQTIEGQADDIASNYILTGSYDFSRRYVEGIRSVTREDIKRVADRYLGPDKNTIIRLIPAGSKNPKGAQPGPAIQKDEIKKILFPNGLRVLIRENNKTPTISITVAMSGGLAVENKDDNGISNFVSSMLLSGTTTRKEDQIRGAIESLGGNISSFSGLDLFGLNLELLKPDLASDLDILKDILTNSTFPEDEIAKNKALVLASIKEEDDDLFQRGLNTLRREVYEGSSYSFRYIGEESSVLSLKRESLINFYKTYCVPNNMVISVSGDVASEEVARKMRELFSDLKEKELPKISSSASRLNKVKTESFKMEKEESLILLGFETTSIKDPDRYSLDVLSSILSGRSGRLFERLRSNLSLAYTLGCLQKLGRERGSMICYVATIKEKVALAKRALFEEIKEMGGKGADSNELVLAKRELVSARRIGAQANGFFSFNSAVDEINGIGYDNIYKYESEIEKVTGDDLKRVANKYLNQNAYAEVTVLSSK